MAQRREVAFFRDRREFGGVDYAGLLGVAVRLVRSRLSPGDGRGKPMLLQEFKWKEVVQSAEPVLVDFWASWCPPCRAMNPTIEALARDFKVCKVNVDTNQELASRYDISSIPALLIFKGGKVVARYVGVTPEPPFGPNWNGGAGAAEFGGSLSFQRRIIKLWRVG